jgi:hypothetical protein
MSAPDAAGPDKVYVTGTLLTSSARRIYSYSMTSTGDIAARRFWRWPAACYVLGALSAGIVPLVVRFVARRCGRPALHLHATQALLWNLPATPLAWYIPGSLLGAPLARVLAGASGLPLPRAVQALVGGLLAANLALNLWATWQVARGHLFLFPGLGRILTGSESFEPRKGKEVAEIAEYGRMLQVPNLPAAYRAFLRWARGYTLTQLGEHHKAIADLSAALESPMAGFWTRAGALYWRGWNWLDQGNWDQAIQDSTALLNSCTVQDRAYGNPSSARRCSTRRA